MASEKPFGWLSFLIVLCLFWATTSRFQQPMTDTGQAVYFKTGGFTFFFFCFVFGSYPFPNSREGPTELRSGPQLALSARSDANRPGPVISPECYRQGCSRSCQKHENEVSLLVSKVGAEMRSTKLGLVDGASELTCQQCGSQNDGTAGT